MVNASIATCLLLSMVPLLTQALNATRTCESDTTSWLQQQDAAGAIRNAEDPMSTTTSTPSSCEKFICPQGTISKLNAIAIIGDDEFTCCDQTCSNFTCNCSAYEPKPLPETIRGFDTGACCNQIPTCSAFPCSKGTVRRQDAKNILGNDQDTCCVKSCLFYSCPHGWKHRKKSFLIAGHGELRCCTKSRQYYSGKEAAQKYDHKKQYPSGKESATKHDYKKHDSSAEKYIEHDKYNGQYSSGKEYTEHDTDQKQYSSGKKYTKHDEYTKQYPSVKKYTEHDKYTQQYPSGKKYTEHDKYNH